MIVAAAIQYQGIIFSMPRPARHHHIINEIYLMGIPKVGREQGFLTDDGQFVDRTVARNIAMNCKQCEETALANELISEDIW